MNPIYIRQTSMNPTYKRSEQVIKKRPIEKSWFILLGGEDRYRGESINLNLGDMQMNRQQ